MTENDQPSQSNTTLDKVSLVGNNSLVDKISPTSLGRRYTDSSSFKMALVFTLLIGVSAGVLSYFINLFNTSNLIDRVEVGLEADFAAFLDWQEMAPEFSVPEIIDRLKENPYRGEYSYQNANGDYVYGSLIPADIEIAEFKENIILLYVRKEDLHSAIDFEGTHRFAAKKYILEDGSRLLIGRDIERALTVRKRMQQLGLLTIVLMLVVIATSFFISTYVVGLTNNISKTANDIMETGDFSRRIPVGSAGDDLGNLATVLNDLLERAENLMQSVRQVSDNIAHDLRTPLARLRNQLDDLDLRMKATGDESAQDITESLIREADHILGTFGALLRIARIESGKREQEFEQVELVPLLEDILELYQPLAEDKGIEIFAKFEEASTLGDPDMLFQVFANLMDNAIKFTPEGGAIELLCRYKNGSVCIELADSGAGISDEDKPKVFDRFFREEKSRHTPGNGLGLSLVQAVMKLHKADISIHDNNPGARFVVRVNLFNQVWSGS